MDKIINLDYNCNINFVDTRSLLQANKDRGLYYKWGTHWNDLAADLVWKDLKSSVFVSGKSWQEERHAELIYRDARPLEDSAWSWFGQSDPSVEKIPEIRLNELNDKNLDPVDHKSNIKVLAFGDSFLQFMFNSAKKYFSNYQTFDADANTLDIEKFDRNSQAWLIKTAVGKIRYEAINNFKPDIILLEIVERNLLTLSNLPSPGYAVIKEPLNNSAFQV